MTLHVEALIPILGIGRTTAYQLVKSGKISTIKVGQKTRVPREAVLNYMKTKKVKRRCYEQTNSYCNHQSKRWRR